MQFQGLSRYYFTVGKNGCGIGAMQFYFNFRGEPILLFPAYCNTLSKKQPRGCAWKAGRLSGKIATFDDALRGNQMNIAAKVKLDAIIASARAIMENNTFPETARVIFDHCCQLTGAISGYVALLSDDGAENELLFLEAGGMPCTVSHDLPMPIRGLREEAYRTHLPVYHNSFMTSKWASLMPEGHVELRNVLFAPLNIDGKTVGIIGLANKERDFNEDDAEITAILGDLAAIALMNSRNIDKLKEQKNELMRALDEVKTLQSLLPMCSFCKNIRDDEGFWVKVDSYISEHTNSKISHSLCPDCFRRFYPDVAGEVD